MASKHLFKTALTANDSAAKEQLGILRREYDSTNGFRTFKYVQASLAGQADSSNGICFAWYDAKGTIATNDISKSVKNIPAGVGVGTLTDTYFGWLQVGGYHSAVDTEGGSSSIPDGSSILLSTSDGKCTGSVAGVASSNKILGIATAAESSDTVAALLDCTYGDIIQ